MIRASSSGSLRERQAFIVAWSALTIPVTVAVGAALEAWVVPHLVATDAASRLAIAARSIAVAASPLAAVIATLMVERLVSGAHNPLLGQESVRLRIHARVLQNTLEQWALFAAGAGASALALPERHLHVLTVAALTFVAGRALFWWGYLRPNNTLGRAPGVQVTACASFGLVTYGAATGLRALLGG